MFKEIQPGSVQEEDYDRLDDQGYLNSTQIRGEIGAMALEEVIKKTPAAPKRRGRPQKRFPRSKRGFSPRELRIADSMPSRADIIAYGRDEVALEDHVLEMRKALERGSNSKKS